MDAAFLTPKLTLESFFNLSFADYLRSVQDPASFLSRALFGQLDQSLQCLVHLSSTRQVHLSREANSVRNRCLGSITGQAGNSHGKAKFRKLDLYQGLNQVCCLIRTCPSYTLHHKPHCSAISSAAASVQGGIPLNFRACCLLRQFGWAHRHDSVRSLLGRNDGDILWACPHAC